MSAQSKKVIVIAGPTGVGKSDVAAVLCKSLRGEIISADSVQTYQGVNIGANKPTKKEQEETKYHLINVVAPTGQYNAADWQKDAINVIDSLDSKFPVVVGGTMMYIQWLVYGRPMAPKPSPEIVQEATDTIADFQTAHDWNQATEFVSKKGAVFAEKVKSLGENDWYRLRRLLEISISLKDQSSKELEQALEEIFSSKRQGGLASDPNYDVRCFFLCPDDRMEHTGVIGLRCEQMLLRGLMGETAHLAVNGDLPENGQPARAIGYRQTLEYLRRENPKENNREQFDQFLDDFCTATRQYAKKQMQWFRKDKRFVFIPVPLQENKEKRLESVAGQISNLISLSSLEFEKYLKDPESLSAQTKERNAAQAKNMKFYIPKRYILADGSDELAQVMKQADESTAKLQDFKISNL